MVRRRVLRYLHRAGAVRSLAVTEEILAAKEAGQHLVQSVCAIADLEPLRAGRTPQIPEGAFLGRVLETSESEHHALGALVVGVGPMAGVFAVGHESTVSVRGDGGTAAEGLALLPLVAAVVAAVGDVDIKVADRVLVFGRGLAADLAGQAVGLHGGRVTRALPADAEPARVDAAGPRDSEEFDVLIDTTADPALWSPRLSLLRDQGRALLLLPPGPQVYPFDFYPIVHRRSLSLVARRVPAMNGRVPVGDAIRTAEHLIRQGLIGARGRLREIRVDSDTADGTTFDLDEAADSGGLVCWFGGFAEPVIR